MLNIYNYITYTLTFKYFAMIETNEIELDKYILMVKHDKTRLDSPKKYRACEEIYLIVMYHCFVF